MNIYVKNSKRLSLVDRVRFAIIGIGGFGKKRADSILRSRCAELTYVVDVDEEAAKNASKDLGVTTVSFEKLLSKNDYDVAIVATPNASHEDIVIKLLKAGRDVWCEKPMSTSIESAHRMVLQSVKTKRMLKVGSNVRYFPNVMKASELIKNGLVGRPLFFRGWIGNEGLHLLTKSWYTRKEMIGGGTLLDNGVHLIDLIRYLVGEISECLACVTTNLKWRFRDLEDNGMAIYKLLNGGVATVHSSWTYKSGYMYFEIHGEGGYVHVDSRWSKAEITHCKDGGQLVHEDYTKYPKLSYDLELEDFVKEYSEGFHPKPTSYDGYRAVKVVFRSYLSASSLKPIATIDPIDAEIERKFMKTFQVR